MMLLVERELRFEGISIAAAGPDDWDGQTAVILAHGAGQNMDSPFMSFFHEGIASFGHVSIKFNFSYMEQGRRAPDPQKKLRASYSGVIELVANEFKPERAIIGGKSMGGRVASYIAGDVGLVRGLVFLGYPLHPPGRPDSLRDEHLYSLNKPMLFLSGTRDTLAKQELLDSVTGKIGKRATLHWVEGGDHSFKVRKHDPDGMSPALDAIRDWIDQLPLGQT